MLANLETIAQIIYYLATPLSLAANALWSYRSHVTLEKVNKIAIETNITAKRTEINTNSLTEKLVQTTSDAQFAAGKLEGQSNPNA